MYEKTTCQQSPIKVNSSLDQQRLTGGIGDVRSGRNPLYQT